MSEDVYLQEPIKTHEIYNPELPMDCIIADPLFNCRGMDITPATVVELAEDIRKYGLHQPILVRPISIPGKPNIKYAVVAGHRRHTACKFLGMKSIKALIRENLAEDQAYIINLAENIKRTQLNIYQEAKAVARLLGFGYSDKEIKARLDVSQPWLKVRKELLRLPEVVREEAANGNLSQAQITELAKLAEQKEPDEIIKAAAKIRDKKLKNENKVDKVSTPEETVAKENSKIDPNSSKFRSNTEIDQMQDLLLTVFRGTNIAARTIAWTRLQISNIEFLEDVKRELGYMGINFTIPPKYLGEDDI